MGEIGNISRRSLRRFGLAAAVLIVLASAAPSVANTEEIPPDRSVSTSPTGLPGPGSANVGPPAALASDDPPLTRAATQQRIEEMSPIHWLSRFGKVSIERRD
jgi:hypothetical protein